MKPLIAVIADDLTGVCDTGAQFASAGLNTFGSVKREFKSEVIPEVLIVNTQSRGLSSQEASIVIQQTAIGLKGFEPKWFFKKIDTALRGNIAAEVLSMMKALGINSVLYAAAIPGAGRTTGNGCQFFRGIPIKESIHGEDRFNPDPIYTSSNVELFSTMGMETELVDLKEVRSGKLQILSRVQRQPGKVVIFDSETDQDLDCIVQASMQIEPSSFFYVGSLGLAGAIGRNLGESRRIIRKQEAAFDVRTPITNKRVFIVSGSSHPMARSQISFIEKKGIAEVIRLKPEDLLERLDKCILEVTEGWKLCLKKRKRIAITIDEGKRNTKKQSQDLVLALAQALSPVLNSNKLDGLIMIGGETGYSVCGAVGIERIDILGSISFVAAYGKPAGSRTNIEVVVTKGGSLGEEDTLEKILNFIDGKD